MVKMEMTVAEVKVEEMMEVVEVAEVVSGTGSGINDGGDGVEAAV